MINGATLRRAGDTVVIAFHGDMTAQLAEEIRANLEHYLPGVTFLLVDQVESVLIRRPDE